MEVAIHIRAVPEYVLVPVSEYVLVPVSGYVFRNVIGYGNGYQRVQIAR